MEIIDMATRKRKLVVDISQACKEIRAASDDADKRLALAVLGNRLASVVTDMASLGGKAYTVERLQSMIRIVDKV